MSTTIPVDFEELVEDEDWAIPCEGRNHGKNPSDDPAEWVVYFKTPFRACGCPRRKPVLLICDFCYQRILHRQGPIYCLDCFSIYDSDVLRSEIAYVERLNEAA